MTPISDATTAEILAASRAAGSLIVRTDPPFRWASGALMPLYTDNRRLIATPRGRRAVRRAVREVIERHGLRFDVVAGTASAGIAPATLVAEDLDLPLVYVRGSAKDHGTARRIEGASAEELRGRRVLLVEDLISTGGSSAAAAEALIGAGADVAACVAIFSYGFAAAAERFAALAGAPPVLPLCSVDALIARGAADGWLSDEDVAVVTAWRADPFGWADGGGARDDGAGDRSSGARPVATARPDAAADGGRSRAAPADLLRASAEQAGHLLCLGIDPRPEALPPGDLADVLRRVIDAVAETGVVPAAVKPNVAFFHRLDRPLTGDFSGSRALATVVSHTRLALPGVPVILDAKRGDIAATSDAYAAEAFDAWGADALTVSPFMGDDSVLPFLEAAAAHDTPRWVYILNRTSNPGAARFQAQPPGEGALFRRVAAAIGEWQQRTGAAGAVIGATEPAELQELLVMHARNPVPVLIPGVGTQGGTAGEVLAAIRAAAYPPELVRVNMSRAVVTPWAATGGAPSDWRGAVREAYLRATEALSWR